MDFKRRTTEGVWKASPENCTGTSARLSSLRPLVLTCGIRTEFNSIQFGPDSDPLHTPRRAWAMGGGGLAQGLGNVGRGLQPLV